MAKLSEACKDEFGGVGWGYTSQPGDQTGKEILIRDIVPGKETWEWVFRWKDRKKAEKFANAMKWLALNDNGGYSQPDRLSLYRAYVLYRSIKDIPIKFNCDCSSGVSCACIEAGLNITPDMTTAVEERILMETGEFEKIPYTEKTRLLTGDIMLRKGHTGGIIEGDEGGVNHVPYAVGAIRKLSWVYSKPSAYAKNHLAEHPRLGKGNLVDICDEAKGKKYEFYYVRIGLDVFGWVRKERVALLK